MDTIGINRFEEHLIHIAKGSSYALMYGELAMHVKGLLRRDGYSELSEPEFRAKLLRACRRGLVAPLDTFQARLGFKDRRYRITPKGEGAIRALNISKGGDFSMNKYWDGKNETLDKYLGPQVDHIEMAEHKRTGAEIFADHNKNPERLKTVQ